MSPLLNNTPYQKDTHPPTIYPHPHNPILTLAQRNSTCVHTEQPRLRPNTSPPLPVFPLPPSYPQPHQGPPPFRHLYCHSYLAKPYSDTPTTTYLFTHLPPTSHHAAHTSGPTAVGHQDLTTHGLTTQGAQLEANKGGGVSCCPTQPPHKQQLGHDPDFQHCSCINSFP